MVEDQGRHKDQAGDHHLEEGAQTQQIEEVPQNGQQEDGYEGAEYPPFAAEQTGSAQHDRSDRIQFQTLVGRRLSDGQP